MLESKVTLRIFSKEHQLIDLSKILGESTKGYSIGDLYSRNNKERKITHWNKESLTIGDFEAHLNEILNFIDLHETEILTLKNTCEFDLFCMLSSTNGQGTTVISSQVMRRISKYDFNLVLDVYLDDE